MNAHRSLFFLVMLLIATAALAQASTDLWFRPVQARTGPDGALYIVDMYRFLIEHPRWIAAERLAQIDARAGAEMGRIYRVVRKGAPLRPVRDLAKLAPADIAAALDTPNGTERDRVHLELLARGDKAAVEVLEWLGFWGARVEVRVQALAVLDGMHVLTPVLIATAFTDANPRVREQAVSKISLMPEGLEETINPQEMADLIAFLRAGTN